MQHGYSAKPWAAPVNHTPSPRKLLGINSRQFLCLWPPRPVSCDRALPESQHPTPDVKHVVAKELVQKQVADHIDCCHSGSQNLNTDWFRSIGAPPPHGALPEASQHQLLGQSFGALEQHSDVPSLPLTISFVNMCVHIPTCLPTCLPKLSYTALPYLTPSYPHLTSLTTYLRMHGWTGQTSGRRYAHAYTRTYTMCIHSCCSSSPVVVSAP